MNFIYVDNRSKKEAKIFDSALRNTWVISDIFPDDDDFVSTCQDEVQRIKWAPVLVSLAFGENHSLVQADFFYFSAALFLEGRKITTAY